MARAITFKVASGAGAQLLVYTADSDYVLAGSVAFNGSGVFSFNPQLDYATATSPSTTEVGDEIILPSYQVPFPLKIPLPKGTSIYLAAIEFGSGALIVLFLDEVI